MLKFYTSEKFTPKEMKFLREFGQFVMDKYVDKRVQRQSLIRINIFTPDEMEDEEDREDLKHDRAWCLYGGMTSGRKRIGIVINSNEVRRNSPHMFSKFKELLICLGHELVHAKQYLNNELYDYADGDARFRGRRYHLNASDDLSKTIQYYESPWELEAFSMEYALFAIFKKKKQLQRKRKG